MQFKRTEQDVINLMLKIQALDNSTLAQMPARVLTYTMALADMIHWLFCEQCDLNNQLLEFEDLLDRLLALQTTPTQKPN